MYSTTDAKAAPSSLHVSLFFFLYWWAPLRCVSIFCFFSFVVSVHVNLFFGRIPREDMRKYGIMEYMMGTIEHGVKSLPLATFSSPSLSLLLLLTIVCTTGYPASLFGLISLSFPHPSLLSLLTNQQHRRPVCICSFPTQPSFLFPYFALTKEGHHVTPRLGGR